MNKQIKIAAFLFLSLTTLPAIYCMDADYKQAEDLAPQRQENRQAQRQGGSVQNGAPAGLGEQFPAAQVDIQALIKTGQLLAAFRESLRTGKGENNPVAVTAQVLKKGLGANTIIVDERAREFQRRTLLYEAVEQNSRYVAHSLMEGKADVNMPAQDQSGALETPLENAAKNKYDDITDMLLNHGAKVSNSPALQQQLKERKKRFEEREWARLRRKNDQAHALWGF
jgi:hypothetical protein